MHYNKLSNERPQTSFVCLMRALGASDSPKGRTSHLYNSYLVSKVVSIITFLHSNLMIPAPKVNYGEDLRTMQFIKHII